MKRFDKMRGRSQTEHRPPRNHLLTRSISLVFTSTP